MLNMDSVYREYARFVYKYLLSLCYEEDMAEELTQETFLGTIYEGLYGGGTQANADDVEITYEKNNGIVSVGFRSTDDSKYIDVLGGTYEKDETGDEVYKWNSIQPVVYRVSPFENQKGYEQGIFVFLDENTILDKNGKILEVTGEEVLEIEFADGTKEIKIQDLYKGNSIQQLK